MADLLEYLGLLQIPYQVVNYTNQVTLPLPIQEGLKPTTKHNYLLNYRRMVFYGYLPLDSQRVLTIGPLTSHRIYGMETFEIFFCYNSSQRYNHLKDQLAKEPLIDFKSFQKLLNKIIQDFHLPNHDLVVKDVHKNPTQTYNFTQLPNYEIQKDIIMAVRYGNIDQIESILDNPALISNSVINAQKLPKKDLQYFYFSTISRINDIAAEAGVTQDKLNQFTSRYTALWQDPTLTPLKIGHLLVRALVDTAHECRNTIYFKSDDPILKKVLRYAADHVEQKIGRKKLATALNLSPSYLSHYFKEKTGMTLTHFINLYKINEAKYLLSTTDLSVMDISEKLAFTNVTYFNRQFSRIAQTTPSAFRTAVAQKARFAPER